jgi:phosphoribosylanthranilate isomerase
VGKITVQIYEIQDPREAEILVELGVDRIGSVLLSGDAWRDPIIREAVLVSKEGGVKHSLIPLFNTEDLLCRAMEYYDPSIIHLCETLVGDNGTVLPWKPLADLQSRVKARFPEMEIMRTIPVAAAADRQRIPSLEIAGHFEETSDSFLIDTWTVTAPVEGYIGITGRVCDWALAARLVESIGIPVILAGGLSPQNVYEGAMATKPFGVDSCTGTNVQDGRGRPVRFRKDYEKVTRFVSETRRAEEDLYG